MDAGSKHFDEGVTVLRLSALALSAVLLAGCTPASSTAGPVQARPVDGWSLSIDNDQHSRVWTFNGFQGCATDVIPDLQFRPARLIDGKGTVTVRAALDPSGQVPQEVEPKPLRDGLVLLDGVTGSIVPVTGCPEPQKPLKFSFEVTSDQEWSADGFEVDYVTAGTTRTLRWKMQVSVCSPAGC